MTGKKKKGRGYNVTASLTLACWSAAVCATDFKSEPPHPGYDHDRFVTQPRDIVVRVGAFLASFDSDDDGVALGVPEFVAYELRQYPGKLGPSPKRPSPWITDDTLYRARVAPGDASYAYSAAFRQSHPNWYDRGHLCAQVHAWRLGAEAAWNSHTVFNAVPQRHDFNDGIWGDLEEMTARWADKYRRLWVVAGPIFDADKHSWLGEPEKGEMPVGIPDALFKIVVREEAPGVYAVLAFRYPQAGPSFKRGPYDHASYLTSVDALEAATGLDFMTALPDILETAIEAVPATEVWPDAR